MLTPAQIAAIQEWQQADAMRKQWEAYERKLRENLVNNVFGDYGDGSKSVDLGSGYTLQNLNATRYDIADKPEMRQLVHQFISYPETAETGKVLLRDKPRLSVKAYKALPQWGRHYLDAFVTTTPNAAQLKIIPPKG